MKLTLHFILLFCALVCFVIAAFKAWLLPTVRIDFTALGFAFVVAAFLFG